MRLLISKLLHATSYGAACICRRLVICEQAEEPSDSDEEDDFVYNPLKLPLGWDGKPIPYWLYKLHGLNQVRSDMVSHMLSEF